jgi:hypothetical protein
MPSPQSIFVLLLLAIEPYNGPHLLKLPLPEKRSSDIIDLPNRPFFKANTIMKCTGTDVSMELAKSQMPKMAQELGFPGQ